jgi:hypothetical protein
MMVDEQDLSVGSLSRLKPRVTRLRPFLIVVRLSVQAGRSIDWKLARRHLKP